MGRWVVMVLLVERLCIVPKWFFEISQSRLFVTRRGFLLWIAVEKSRRCESQNLHPVEKDATRVGANPLELSRIERVDQPLEWVIRW